METAEPPLKSKPMPSASPNKRDTIRARVFPSGTTATDDRAGRQSTSASTRQTRESSVGSEPTQRTLTPSRILQWWRLPARTLAVAHTARTGVRARAVNRRVGRAAVVPNGVAILRSFVSHIGASFGITLVVKQALEFSDRVYPFWRCLLLACLASGTNETVWTLLAFAWRFPIPFREVLCAATWFVWFVLFHYVAMRRVFALKKRRMRLYLPVFTVQFGMFSVFLALAVVFTYLRVAGQVLLTLVVPPLKVAVKRLVWRLTKQLDDLSTDVTVCVVEISAAMYQCLVMQYAASPLIPVLVFLMDLLQAAIEVALFVDHSFLVRGETAMAVAVDIIAQARVVETRRHAQVDERDAGSLLVLSARTVPASVCEGGKRSVASMAAPVRISSRASSVTVVKMADPATGGPSQFLDFRTQVSTPSPASLREAANLHVVDGLPIPRATDAWLLTQLMRLLFATEMLLFVEFIEVVLALLYVMVFGLASVLPGGAYIVSLMALSDQGFADAMANATLYAALELLSFAIVFWLLKRQCGLSTLYQIAYVLDQYWMTIQGKIITCLLLLLNLATPHQGTDCTFQFLNYN